MELALQAVRQGVLVGEPRSSCSLHLRPSHDSGKPSLQPLDAPWRKAMTAVLLAFRDRLFSVCIWIGVGFLTLVFGGSIPLLNWLIARWDPSQYFPHWMGQRWARSIVSLNPLWQMKVRGREHLDPHKPYILVSNHQSMGDIIAVYHLGVHFKWISKESNFKVPIMGPAMRLAGYISVRRGDRQSGHQALVLAGEWLRRGVSVFFFAEGTRSEDGHLREFKPGAFKLALETGFPILPIAINGCRDVLPKRSWIFGNKAEMAVAIGEPVEVEGRSMEDLEELTTFVRARIYGLLAELERPDQAKAA